MCYLPYEKVIRIETVKVHHLQLIWELISKHFNFLTTYYCQSSSWRLPSLAVPCLLEPVVLTNLDEPCHSIHLNHAVVQHLAAHDQCQCFWTRQPRTRSTTHLAARDQCHCLRTRQHALVRQRLRRHEERKTNDPIRRTNTTVKKLNERWGRQGQT